TGSATNVVSVGSRLLDLQPANNTLVTPLVFENPPIITLQPVSRIITNGEAVQFTGAAIGTGPLAYQWLRNSAEILGATAPALRLTNASPANAGRYQLRVSNRAAVALSDPVLLVVLGPPTLSDLPAL